jgi:hypothetical protein
METEMVIQSLKDTAVGEVFAGYPDELRSKLLRLRELILEVASETDSVGQLEETLKWGQPSYLTHHPKSGTTIRIDGINSNPRQYGIFVHCQTSLVPTYRELYSEILEFDGDRAIVFDMDSDPPEDVLRHCIELALTYHQAKRRTSRAG